MREDCYSDDGGRCLTSEVMTSPFAGFVAGAATGFADGMLLLLAPRAAMLGLAAASFFRRCSSRNFIWGRVPVMARI